MNFSSNKKILTKKIQIITGTTSQLQINQHSPRSLITSLEYSMRNFGRNCDSGYSYQSEQHRVQKFGNLKKVVKLDPLYSLKKNQAKKIKPLILRNPLQDDDDFCDEFYNKSCFKKIFHHKDNCLIFIFRFLWFSILFRTFQIKYSLNSNMPSVGPGFYLTLRDTAKIQRIITLSNLIKHFKSSLSYDQQKNKIIYNNQDDFDDYFDEEFGEEEEDGYRDKIVIKSNFGYYHVNFPTAAFYVPEFTYSQDYPVERSTQVKLLKEKFQSITPWSFNNESFMSFRSQLNLKESLKKPSTNKDLRRKFTVRFNLQEEKQIQQLVSQTKKSNSFQKSSLVEDLEGVIICDPRVPGNRDEILKKKIIKVIHSKNSEYHLISFIPSYIVLSERKEDEKVICKYFLTLIEFYNLIKLSQVKQIKEFLEKQVQVEGEFELESENFLEYKKEVIIKPNLPLEDFNQNIQIENFSFLQKYQRAITIKNKDFLLELNPPVVQVFDILEKQLFIKDINSNSFDISFQLI